MWALPCLTEVKVVKRELITIAAIDLADLAGFNIKPKGLAISMKNAPRSALLIDHVDDYRRIINMVNEKCRARGTPHTDGQSFWFDIEPYKVCKIDRSYGNKLTLDNLHFGQTRQGSYPNLLQFRLDHMFVHMVRLVDLLVLLQECLKASRINNTETAVDLNEKYLFCGLEYLNDEEVA